ncbi:FAD/NAD(P)-binding domain-containing protein [Trichodelitschia bisporula]|uniref:FAD/NAD(P)-binding domain-containing protein n=1 Tax=Trichodelitschia bisporula TaxID=703511 RepID=A0A6G1HV63_9PEZI|nr:FAD/NAD(P)-binding domain-containing protein [Trichodelitschia bisporula]
MAENQDQEQEQEQEKRVIIVGAGLAGLAIAHGLKKNNIPHLILDRESTPRGRNWGITLSWALPLFTDILPERLASNLRQCQPDLSLPSAVAGKKGVLIRDGSTGKTLAEAHFPVIRRMQIQKTKRALAEGLDVKAGKKLIDIRVLDGGGVEAIFEDGSVERGGVVVGCDGGASAVRRWLLGEKQAAQEVLPFAFMNFAFSLPADKARWLDAEMNPSVDVAAHPKGMYLGLFILDKPDLEKPEGWVFYILATWPIQGEEDETNAENRLERLRAKMGGWADPYKSVVEWLDDGVQIGRDALRIWHPVPWENFGGRVSLAGDAAHSMTFHRGQGGNLAIKDAHEFVATMVKVRDGMPLADAMRVYDEGVRERGEEVEISKQQAIAFHDFERFLESPVVQMGIKPK